MGSQSLVQHAAFCRPCSQVVAPGFSLSLGANGQLVPETLLTNTTTVTIVTNVTNNAVSPAVPFSPGPVGNPDGATSFTIWQPGSANFISLADPSSVYPMYTWSTDFAA